ncbi:MAG: OpgC domain-containing protein [Candidatus Saccharimonadales bacterium]
MFSLFHRFHEKKLNRDRILALDLLRGTFLIEIIVAHIAWSPSLFTFISGGNQLPASAAEGFFTISGLLVGYLYGPKIIKDTKKTVRKIWKRAFLLYFLATFFTFFYSAWAVLEPNSAVYQTLYAREPWRFLLDTFTMRYAFGWAEFLNRYAMFMLFAPLAVWLVAKGRAWIVAVASFAVWFFLRDVERFLPFSPWQLVFMFGIILGYYLPHIEDWFGNLTRKMQRTIFVSVCGVAVVSYTLSVLLFALAPLVMAPDSHVMQLHNQLLPYFDKTHLAPARVAVGVVWFAALYLLFRRFEKNISRGTRGVLEVFGKQSLFVYGLHAFILFVIDLYFRPPLPTMIIWNTVVTFVVLTIIYVAALYRTRVTEYGKRLLRNKDTTQVP